MSEELDSVVDQPEIEQPQDQTVEQPNAELAPDSPSSEGEQVTEQPEVVDRTQKAINKKHRQMKEAEERAAAAEARALELEAKYETPKQPNDIVIPDLPDQWDENYAQQLQVREQAIAEKARLEASHQSQLDQQALEQRQQQLENERKIQEQVGTFQANATKLNISPEAVQESAATVAQYGVSPQVEEFLLTDESGPLIMQHLAANPLELDALATMNPVQIGVYIETEIKPKASALKPKTSTAPAPAETLNGRGALPEVDQGEAMGITYHD